MLGATPGAYVAETQVQVNLAPISQGAANYVSTAHFKYSSVLGTQISAPLSSMPYAEQQATSPSFGLPGANLLGANYETVVSVCPQATSFCTTPSNVQGPQYETSLIPSLNSVSSTLALQNLVTALNSTPLSSVYNDCFNSNAGSAMSSSTSFTSSIAILNGTPTDWSQTETQSATLNNNIPLLATVLAKVGNLVNPLLNLLFPSALTVNVQNVYNYLTSGGGALANADTSTANGVFPGQLSSNANPSCGAGTTNLYTGTATITPGFGPVFTSPLDSSSTPNTQTMALTTTDSIGICGTESQALAITQILPGQSMTGSTAAGASTLALLR